MLENIKSFLDLTVPFLALLVAIIIPKRIMWAQTYSDLLKEYRSYDYALAVEGIVDFFHDECGCDISKIPQLYRKRYKADREKNVKLRLHEQRRLIAQYYFHLDDCLRTPFLFFERGKILRDYGTAEKNLLKIVYIMNIVVEESPEIYKDIATKSHLPKLKKNSSNMERKIYHIMNRLG